MGFQRSQKVIIIVGRNSNPIPNRFNVSVQLCMDLSGCGLWTQCICGHEIEGEVYIFISVYSYGFADTIPIISSNVQHAFARSRME